MSKVALITRYILGVLLVIFGLNGFFNFIPMDAPTGVAGEFMMGLFKSGYVFPVIKLIEIATGVAFLTNRFTALASIVFMPIAINILLYHAVLEPASGLIAYVVFVFALIQLIAHKAYYMPLLKPKTHATYNS
ncbi:hypothetical protein [Carboxylicivirga caseinilyticus]|uniref:hypothetical protein n=1 Tax=Carboxylicivirga caseinilyticus TaxID=3417572 RepID=UPI002AA84A11|nr:hypothetical protein [uncultured Carboxylicivirga sp.]MCU4162799.1 hypothetical protein [Marinilabiliaceae bacterium A049]